MPQTINLNHAGQIPATPFLAVGHSLRLPALPNLAPSRFSLADQQSAPNEPRTRILKDVLRLGRWKVGAGPNDFWDVTPETLTQLANEFKLAQSRGISMNLYWGARVDDGQHNVSVKDAIAPIDQVFSDGERLWMTAYVTPDVSMSLKNPANKVSIRAARDWPDGHGNVYSLMLLHVAVVDNPVMSGQGPFVDLSNELRRLFQTANGGAAMDLQELTALINELLPSGVTLPEDLTDEDFVSRLRDTVNIIKQLNGEEPTEETTDAPPETPEPPPNSEPTPPQMSNAALVKAIAMANAPLLKQVQSLANEVKSLKSDKANAAKVAYETRLAELGAAGLPGKEVAALKTLGAKHGYDMALLDVAAGNKQINMSRVGKSSASSAAPGISTNGNGRMSDDDVAGILKEKGIDPAKVGGGRIIPAR